MATSRLHIVSYLCLRLFLLNTSQLVRWVGIEISGYLLDTLGAALATYFVWPLRMTITRKLLVLSIFNCRLM